MKVALVGGTGPFGRALAARLVEAGDDVVIGSRDATRAAEIARELGAEGASNADAVRGVDLVVLAMSRPDAALDTIADLRATDAPLLSVASRLVFAAKRAHPADDPLSLAEHIAAAVDVPVAAGLHSLAAGKLAKARPDEDALVCGDDPRCEGARAGAGRPHRRRPRDRRRAARHRPRARRHDRRDREREPALQGARRAPPHRSPVIEIRPVEGLPEIVEGDDLASLIAAAIRLEDGDVLVVAQKAVSKMEGRIVRLADVEPSPRARELAGDGDPRRTEVILGESARVVRSRPPLLIAETHHGFVCASAGVDASNAPGADTLVLLPVDPDASAAALRARLLELTGRSVAVIVSDSFGRAWRQGTTDIAIGVSGLAPLLDLRGQLDRAGYELHATTIAVADEIAGAAELVMGKSAGIPAAVVRGLAPEGDGSARELVMPPERDLFR